MEYILYGIPLNVISEHNTLAPASQFIANGLVEDKLQVQDKEMIYEEHWCHLQQIQGHQGFPSNIWP